MSQLLLIQTRQKIHSLHYFYKRYFQIKQSRSLSRIIKITNINFSY